MVKPAGLRVEVAHAPRGVVVAAHGEIDIATVDRLSAALDLHVDRPLALDLRGVTFMDSSGLAVLLELHRRARRDDLRFCVAPGEHPGVQRVLELSGLLPVLDLVGDPLDAVG